MDISRLLFVLATRVTVIGGVFLLGMYSGVTRNALYRGVADYLTGLRASILAVEETAVLAPKGFLIEDSGPAAGVTIDRRGDDGALTLVSGFFDDDNGLVLMRHDGTAVARWKASFHDLFPDDDFLHQAPSTNWNIDTHGALALPDGSVVFNFEYGGLVKLDRCGRPVWTLEHPTHHSVELAEGGGFWVPGRDFVNEGTSAVPPFEAPFMDDLILRVSDDGRILTRLSVSEVLYENGLEALLTARQEHVRIKGLWRGEVLHLNKIAELPAALAPAFPQFAAGDLLLSMRTRNLVLVLDPSSRQVKWWQVGPWRRQHDPEFGADGRIILFNNNAYVGIQGDAPAGVGPWQSNVMAVDPKTGATEVLFGETPEQSFFSLVRGKHDLLDDGGLLVTVAEQGTVIQSDGAGNVIWQYVNRYDAAHLAKVSEARLYPPGYFTVTDWTCPARP